MLLGKLSLFKSPKTKNQSGHTATGLPKLPQSLFINLICLVPDRIRGGFAGHAGAIRRRIHEHFTRRYRA